MSDSDDDRVNNKGNYDQPSLYIKDRDSLPYGYLISSGQINESLSEINWGAELPEVNLVCKEKEMQSIKTEQS